MKRDELRDIGKLTENNFNPQNFNTDNADNTHKADYPCNTWKSQAVVLSAGCLLGILSIPVYIAAASAFGAFKYLGNSN